MNELATTGAGRRSFCTFRVDGRLYGIEVAQVREVSLTLPVTRMPQAPAAIRGLVNLRSRIYLALDIRPLLGLPPIELTSESRLLILKPHVGQDLGILVEHGGDIVHASVDQIEASTGAPDPAAGGASSMVSGVCKLEGELLVILDPVAIVNDVVGQMR